MSEKHYGSIFINGKKMADIPIPDNQFKPMEKEIKKSLIDFMTLYDFDYDNDTLSYTVDLGEGYTLNYHKSKKITV